MIQQRYFTDKAMARLNAAHVVACGVGGVGGHVAATLVRMGVGALTVIDGDTFEASNKNRQLGALDSTLGQPKARVLEAHLRDINAEARITGIPEFVSEANFRECFAGADLVVDCVDGFANKLLINRFCREADLPCVTSGVGGTHAHVAVITDHDKGRAYYEGRHDASPAANPATVLVLSGLIAHEAAVFLLGETPKSLNRAVFFRHEVPGLWFIG